MKLFAGLSRSDYQDLFRAVGALLDEQRLQDVRLWEQADGLLLQARRVDEGGADVYETFLLTDVDLLDLLNRSYRRRGLPERRLLGDG